MLWKLVLWYLWLFFLRLTECLHPFPLFFFYALNFTLQFFFGLPQLAKQPLSLLHPLPVRVFFHFLFVFVLIDHLHKFFEWLLIFFAGVVDIFILFYLPDQV